MDTTQYCSNVIKNSIYEPGLIRRTLNFLINYDDLDDLPEFCPILYRQVNTGYPDSKLINSQSLHKALLKRIKIELDDKYPKLQRKRRENEKMILECENNNKNSYIHKLPIDIIYYEISEFL